MLVPAKQNLCSKHATKMLSIKVNNNCNANCSFCVDRNGYNAKTIDVEKIAESVISNKQFKTVIITGGEPFLNFKEVIKLLDKIRQFKKRIVLNTNGSLLMPQNVEKLNGRIDELQISIHSPNSTENNKVFKKQMFFYNIKHALRNAQFKVSINSTFNVYTKDKMNFVDDMIDLCIYLGANQLRLTELKKVDDTEFVSASEYFPIGHKALAYSSNELITKGCTYHYTKKGIRVSVKRLCEYAKGKDSENFSCCFINTEGQLKIDVDTKQTFKVVYSDGTITNDWIFNK